MRIHKPRENYERRPRVVANQVPDHATSLERRGTLIYECKVEIFSFDRAQRRFSRRALMNFETLGFKRRGVQFHGLKIFVNNQNLRYCQAQIKFE
jgi:hypothetical protein